MRKKVFCLLAMAWTALTVSAAEWVKPTTPKLSGTSEFKIAEDKDDDAYYYLWNEEFGAFLGEGNEWGISAALLPEKGIPLYFQKYKIDGVEQPDNYLFNNYSVNGGGTGWDYMWIPLGDINDLDVDWRNLDRGYGDKRPVWNYEFNGNHVRIKTGSLQPTWNFEEQRREFYIGKSRELAADDTHLTANCTEDDNIDWTVVTKADYEAFQASLNAFYASEKLSEAIEISKAKYPGIDLSSVEAVYNNLSSTAEELKAAQDQIPALEKAYSENNINNASVDNPFDATAYILNPNYDDGAANWEGGLGSNGEHVGSYWNSGTESYDFYQTLTGLPNGVYEVQVHAAHRIGPSGNYGVHYQTGVLDPNYEYLRTSQIYANNYWILNNDITSEMIQEDLGSAYWDKEMINGYYIPLGTSYVVGAYNELDMFDNSLFCAVTDGTLKIGIRCQDRMAGSWTSFDTWRLTYYGNTDDALALMKANLLLGLNDYSEDMIYAGLKETYSKALADLEAATTAEAVEAAYSQAAGMFYDIEKNKNAYAHFMEKAEKIMAEAEGLNGDKADELSDFFNGYDEFQFGDIVENMSADTEKLAELEKWMEETLDAAIKESVEEGKDFTNLLKDADCSIGDFNASGWEGIADCEKIRTGEEGKIYRVAEVWNFANFDIHQTLTDMPKGIYELTFPALYRAGDKDYTHPSKAEIYVNDLAKDVMKASQPGIEYNTIMDYHDNWTDIEGYNCYNYGSENIDGGWPYDCMAEAEDGLRYWPSSVFGASVAFNAGRYMNKVYGIVGEDGILKFGMRSKNTNGRAGDWLTYGHITMKYMGNNADALAGLKEEVAEQAATYMYMEDNFYTGYLEVVAEKLGNVLAAESQKDIIAAIKELNEAYGLIDESVNLYKKMYDVINNETSGLYAAAANAMEKGTITEEEGLAMMERAEEINIIYALGTANNEETQKIIDEVLANKLVDVIYIRGGLVGVQGDSWDSTDYPMYKNAEGKYVGTASFREEVYGNDGISARSSIIAAFHYMGHDIAAADNQSRWLTNSTEPRPIKMDSQSWFQSHGGDWEFTIDLENMTLSAKPVTPFIYKQQIYAVGNLKDNSWTKNYPCAAHWDIQHMGDGIYQGSIAFNPGVERGEITLFSSEAWLLGNWDEGRIGNPTDQLKVESGEETLANRFEGDRKWILDPSKMYLVTYDLNKGTVRFDEKALEGDDTEESPLLIGSYEDMLMMRAYLRQGETHYFALTDDIWMGNKPWSQLNGEGEQNGRNEQRWISLDGRGHVIKGFHGETGVQGHKNTSFFGTFAGTLKNIGFVQTDVKEVPFVSKYVPGVDHVDASVIADKLGSTSYKGTTTLENVFVMADMNGGKDYAGIFAGTVNGNVDVKNCYAIANITTEAENAAGLFGRVNGKLNVENAYFAGETTTPAIAKTYTAQAEATMKNIANFTQNEAGCEATNLLSFNGSNFADLQHGVVAFDNTVWYCGMGADEYPILKAFKEVIDGVNTVIITDANNSRVFDLSGRQVKNAQKGIYIQNGKKVVIK